MKKLKTWIIVIATAVLLVPLTFYEEMGLTYLDSILGIGGC